MKRHVTGVTTDTSMAGLPQMPSDEVHQVLPPLPEMEPDPIPIFRGEAPELLQEEEPRYRRGKPERKREKQLPKRFQEQPEGAVPEEKASEGEEKHRSAKKPRSSQEEIQTASPMWSRRLRKTRPQPNRDMYFSSQSAEASLQAGRHHHGCPAAGDRPEAAADPSHLRREREGDQCKLRPQRHPVRTDAGDGGESQQDCKSGG